MTSIAQATTPQTPIAPPRRIRLRQRILRATVPPQPGGLLDDLRGAADSALRTAGAISAVVLVDVVLTLTRPLGALLLAASTGGH